MSPSGHSGGAAQEATLEGAALCERLAASRAPFYGPRDLREIIGLKERIEALALGLELSAARRAAEGREAEAAAARASARRLRGQLAALLSAL